MTEICAVHGYAALFEHAPVGLAEMDTKGRILRANPRLGEMLACDPADLAGGWLRERLSPDDAESCEAQRRDLLDGGCPNCRVEVRLTEPAGSRSALAVSPRRMTARKPCWRSFADIEARKRTEQRMDSLLRASPAVIYTMEPDELGTMTWLSRKDGEIFPLHEIVTAIHDGHGKIECYIAMSHDITRQKELETALEHQAFYDPLIGAANRGYFETLLEQEVRRALRYQHPCSLLLLDIDHFKRINDTFGHEVDDEVLRCLVHALEGRLRETDVLGRWGGEEFVVLLPGADAERARHVAEKLREAVAGASFPRVGQVTISLGVAEYQVGEPIKDWMKRADEAMYAAKDGGRNRVVRLSGDDSSESGRRQVS